MTSDIFIQDSLYTGNIEFNDYPFELSDFQKHAIDGIEQGHNVIVTAPTSCGKTLVAEHLIKKAFKLDSSIIKRKVIYTTPIKALSNCLFNSLRERFKDIDFGILTGDIKYNPDADCVIMTTEILRNLLYNKKIKTNNIELSVEIDIYSQVYGVIFDEIHYIANRERGSVWEECLILLPSDIQIIGLSATIDHPEIFGKWLMDIKGVPLTLSKTDKRVVPLKHYVYLSFIPKFNKLEKTEKDETTVSMFQNNIVEIMDHNGVFNEETYNKVLYLQKRYATYISKYSVLNDLSRFLKTRGLLPSIMFTLSRKKCEEYAETIELNLNDDDEKQIAVKIFDQELVKSKYYKTLICMPEYFKIKRLISKGIAYHHSGVYHLFKEIIEKMLSYKDVHGKNKPLIKLLFATETFAVGVNIPVKASCYTGITKYSDDGFRYLKSYEYKQMSGRAGRRGMDKQGIAILIPNLYDLPKPREMYTLMNGGNQQIISRFKPNFQFILKIILTGNNQIMRFIKKSLLNKEVQNQEHIISDQLNNVEIPRIEFNLSEYEEYYKLVNADMHSFIKVSQKTMKKNKKQARIIMNKPGFKFNYNIYLKYKDKIKKKEELLQQLNSNNYYIHNSIIKVLEFLQINEYIETSIHISDYEEIVPDNITVKGLISSQINECNEILFTELIMSGHLDTLSSVELVCVLSVFLQTKINGMDEVVNLYNTNIPNQVIHIIESLKNKGVQLEDYLNKLKMYMEMDWSVSLNMVEIVYDWYNGEDFNTLINKYSLYPGSFVKDMIKLDNIVQDIIKIANILNKDMLASSASFISEKIIRDNVNNESLYVSFN